MGVALTQARGWAAKRRADLPAVDQDFIDLSARRESRAKRRARRVQVLVYLLLVGVIAGLLGWINQSFIVEAAKWYANVRPYMVNKVRRYVLEQDAERALKLGDSFRECAKSCPQMIVIPAGSFVMGSPKSERGHDAKEVLVQSQDLCFT